MHFIVKSLLVKYLLISKFTFVLLGISFFDFNFRKSEGPIVNSPDDALNELIYGNNRFLDNQMIYTNYHKQIENSKKGQHPHSFILGCIDSRVPPEIIFDQGIGNIFVARVAGNVQDDNILGSLEYSVKVKHTKLIVVLGHSHCGAVQGTIDDFELEHLTQLTQQIRPAYQQHHATYPIPDVTAEQTTRLHVKFTMKKIYESSLNIKNLVDLGELKIVGGYYNIESGEVEFIHYNLNNK